jgi:AcrR family transcriptional regulator
MKETRRYAMSARAQGVADTQKRIVAAALALSAEKMSVEITLDDVAARSQVSVQTVLRHFGTRDGLIDAAALAARSDVIEERSTPAGDIKAAVRTVVQHYERRGDFVLRMLGQAFADARIRSLVEPGKELHRGWVQQAFGPQLVDRSAGEQETLVDLLVVATDLYTWQLLRRDRGLSRVQVEARMRRLIDGILQTKEGQAL